MQIEHHDLEEITSTALPQAKGLAGQIIDEVAAHEAKGDAASKAISIWLELGESLILVPEDSPNDHMASAKFAASVLMLHMAPERPKHLMLMSPVPIVLKIATTRVVGRTYEVFFVKYLIGPAQ